MAITFNTLVSPQAVFTYDASANAYVNVTASTAFNIFPDDCAVGDILYVGQYFYNTPKSEKFRNIQIDVGTARDGTVTFVWEYYKYGGTWTALTVTDNTNGFSTTGQNTIEFTPPSDWRRTTVNGANLHWIRCRVSASSGVTEGGATQKQTVQVGNNIILATAGESLASIYAADVAGGWGVITNLGNYYRIEGGNILIWGGSSLNLTNLFVEVARNWRFDILGTATTFNKTYWRAGYDHVDCMGNNWNGTYPSEKAQLWSNGGSAVDSVVEFYAGYACVMEIKSNATWRACIINSARFALYAYSGNPSHYNCLYRAGTGVIDLATSFTVNSGTTIYCGTLKAYSANPILDDARISAVATLDTYHGNLTLNNPVFEDTTYNTSAHPDDRWIKIYYTINLLVEDIAGTPIEGAAISIVDSASVEQLTLTTDVNGKASGDLLQLYTPGNTDTKVDYNPFTITVSKAGYADSVDSVSVTREYPSESPYRMLLAAPSSGGGTKTVSAGILNYGQGN